jgi:hypothetical protein
MPHSSQDETPHGSTTHSLTIEIAVFLVGLFLRLVSVAQCPANTIHFRSPHRYMIVVPVRVNGAGPYSFLLDTGATSSEVDPQLSTSLHLSAAHSARLASWEDTMDARRVLVQSLALGTIDSGPLTVLVQPLSEFKALDPRVRGVLGQDVLLHSNYLIDNRHHFIRFDKDGAVLQELTGDRVSMMPVSSRAGTLEPRLIGIQVQTDMNREPLDLLLDSGADMVVLQPHFVSPVTIPKGTKWIADGNGKLSSATTFHTRLSVGSEAFSAEVWVGNAGLKQLDIDGLLPTGSFDQLYIDNSDAFVIFEPGHISQSATQNPERAASSSLHP